MGDNFILGLDDAAEYAGVSRATIYRWIQQRLLTEDEVDQTSTRVWVIDRDALDRVRKMQIMKGRGAFCASSLRFHTSPKGYLTIRLSEIADSVLIGWLFELGTIYDESHKVVGENHKRLQNIHAKIDEVHKEIQRRNLPLTLSPEIEHLIRV